VDRKVSSWVLAPHESRSVHDPDCAAHRWGGTGHAGFVLGANRTCRERRERVDLTKMSSRAEEFHLRALPDTYVNRAIHTAPVLARSCRDLSL
jgi:hypothetical protein